MIVSIIIIYQAWSVLADHICLLPLLIVSLVFTPYIFEPVIHNWSADDDTLDEENLTTCRRGMTCKRHILSLVIPAYNEENRLPTMLDSTLEHLIKSRNEIVKYCKAITAQIKDHDATKYIDDTFELIIVNDGSTDRTLDIVKHYVKSRKLRGMFIYDYKFLAIRLLSLRQNSGKGAAVRAGMIRSDGHLCLMLDADGATDFVDGLEKVLKEMSVNNDIMQTMAMPSSCEKVVFGSRSHLLQDEHASSRTRIRTVLMQCFHIFVKKICSNQIQDTQCGFKLFTRDAALLLFSNLHLRRWAFDTELIIMAERSRIALTEVPVKWHEVDGSKLYSSKVNLALASIGMLRDIICVKVCYSLGIWRMNTQCP